MVSGIRVSLRGTVNRVLTRGSDYGLNLVAAAATQGATFLTAVVLTRILTGDSFGRYVVGQSTVVTLGALSSLSLGFVANAMLARHAGLAPARAASIHRFCLIVASLSGVVAGIFITSSSRFLAEHLFHDPSVQTPILIAGIALPFAALASYQVGAMAGLSDFRGLVRVAVAGALSLVAAASVGAWIAGATGAMVGLLLSLMIRAAIGAVGLRARRTSFFMRAPDIGLRETWREIRHFAIPTLMCGVATMLAIWLSNAILTTHAGTRAFGVFTSAFLIKTLVTFVPLQFGNVLLSRLSTLSAKGDVIASRRTHTIVLLAGTGVAVVLATPLAIGANHVMAVFGPGFTEGAPLLRWLMLCAVFEAAATLTFYAFPGRGKLWQAALVYSVPKEIVLVSTAFFLASRFGAMGLVWAHTSSWLYGLLALTTLNAIARGRWRSKGSASATASPNVPVSAGRNGHQRRGPNKCVE
ncbi:oligosaccharide flippase family protein [Mycobacterium sp. URHB0044]|uniref:oligosaccharide flippase family protein n=1 Tax=Mycobacterium sp. URHB0044 TaxID=1380386 RepID=UPI00048E0790|nr:oligosaccharide flippase family protein [Mycobacterium sp. URHB0044]